MGAKTFSPFWTSAELLQYFTSAGVTFAAADKSLSAADIAAGLTAGDVMMVSGSSDAANNTAKTLQTVAVGKLTTEEAIVNDNAGEVIKLKQRISSTMRRVDFYARLVGIVGSSGDCTVVFSWSNDAAGTVSIDVTTNITGGTPVLFDVDVPAPYLRIRITNGEADQTTFGATFWVVD